jgi:hypothetical protein
MSLKSSEARVVATIVIWLAYTAMVIWGKPIEDPNTMIGVVSAAAAISTFSIWFRAGGMENESQRAAKQSSEKPKHLERDRVARLADMLDDHEAAALLDELRNRVTVQDDGEAVPLDTLLEERERRLK